jgi:hypothetical protein
MRKLLLVTLASVGLVSISAAQSGNSTFIDTVMVRAIDPDASETGADPGTFEIRRSGPTNFSLRVFFQIGGTASNGVDYETISTTVLIPEGILSALVPVKPIPDTLIERAETVLLQIVPSPLLCPAPSCGYYIGSPSNAVVTIADSAAPPPTNQPPFVQLNSPPRGEQFIAPAEIALRAYAQDAEDGYTLRVEFFEGERSLGFGTFDPTRCAPPYCPNYTLLWSNVPPGNYVITARATDRAGATSVSDAGYVIVLSGVNIYASDPNASEQSALVDAAQDTATFTVRRFETNGSIVVYYEISGTASNGVDYEKLSGQVTIPDGAASADVVVTPIDDQLAEGIESVELTLLAPCPACLFGNPACEIPQGTNCYPIGPHSKAIAYIRDNDAPLTNLPVVTIVATDSVAVEGQFCGSNWWWTASTSDGRFTTNSRPPSPCPGTNSAAFEVRRNEGTNSDLTVYYTIGGTASNGIDYVTLPTSVTIPAGRYAARIQVLPIEDKIVEGAETVVLGLTAPTRPPLYLFGYSRRAAAIILDNDQPRPSCSALRDGLFHLCAPGTNGFAYCIRTSTDLVTWTSLCTNVVSDGAVHFVDAEAGDMRHRFYRVVPDSSSSPPQ